jgi:hypothetical protein
MIVSTSAQLNLKPKKPYRPLRGRYSFGSGFLFKTQKLYCPPRGRYSFGSGFLIMLRYLKSSLRKLLQQEHETS